MENKKGITLIALVITVIVLLILAGVSISLVVGNNGILTQASNAAVTNREAKAQEEVAMAVASAETEYWTEWAKDSSKTKAEFFTSTNLSKYVEETGIITNIEVSDDEKNYTIKYQSNDQGIEYTFVVDENGNVAKPFASTVTPDWYGKEVNYGVTYEDDSEGGSKWEIFYADRSNIYLITKGWILASSGLSIEGYGGTDDFLDSSKINKYPAVVDGWLNKIYSGTGNTLNYESSYDNMKATQYLLDSKDVWNSTYKNNYAKWAIGGPTLELLVASYNAIKISNQVIITIPKEYGYLQTIESGLVNNTVLNRGGILWIAGPSAIGNDRVFELWNENERLSNSPYKNGGHIFRPVVCLKSNITLTWNDVNNSYDINEK